MVDLMTGWDAADAELVKTEEGVRWLLAQAWAEGYKAGAHDEGNSFSGRYVDTGRARNPYNQK